MKTTQYIEANTKIWGSKIKVKRLPSCWPQHATINCSKQRTKLDSI